MHRIQNIVVPPRRRPSRSTHRSFFHALSRAIFPLNLASSLVRLVLRLPSLFFLSNSLMLWIIVLAQTAQCDLPWLDALAPSLAQQDTAALCWFTFCSVCGALCIEALTRALEGGNGNASPFNLVCHSAAWLSELSPRLLIHHHNVTFPSFSSAMHFYCTYIRLQ